MKHRLLQAVLNWLKSIIVTDAIAEFHQRGFCWGGSIYLLGCSLTLFWSPWKLTSLAVNLHLSPFILFMFHCHRFSANRLSLHCAVDFRHGGELSTRHKQEWWDNSRWPMHALCILMNTFEAVRVHMLRWFSRLRDEKSIHSTLM